LNLESNYIKNVVDKNLSVLRNETILASVASVNFCNNLQLITKILLLFFRHFYFLSFLLSSKNKPYYYRYDRTKDWTYTFFMLKVVIKITKF